MIRVSEITKEFKQGKEEKKVLDKVSWDVPDGTITGLVGRKGSGKTVALRIITGIQNPSHGKVMLDGYDIMVDTLDARISFGYVPADTEQFQGLTGAEYLNFIADIYEVSEENRKSFMEKYAGDLKVELYLKHRMSTYTKSMYKKIMLLGAMIHQPRNLILDGFFDGLDDSDVEPVKKTLKKYAEHDRAILVSETRLKVVDGLCSKVVLLISGKVKYDGTMEGLKEKYGSQATLDTIELMLHKDTEELFKQGEEELASDEKDSAGRRKFPWSKLFDKL
ncbi:MAG: ABC transporter ATP-binding protein [Lachnospiraceae bacterium]|nr:ABC transporter ATP-binding protein [Lachnospiraceae bacterium]